MGSTRRGVTSAIYGEFVSISLYRVFISSYSVDWFPVHMQFHFLICLHEKKNVFLLTEWFNLLLIFRLVCQWCQLCLYLCASVSL